LWWGADPEIHERMERIWDGRVFSFAIDGITGARIGIGRPHFFQVELAEDPSHIVTREEARAAFDMRHRALMFGDPDPFPLYLTESEMELYLQMARTYAERHFAFTNVAEVVFEQVVPIELGRDEAGEIIAIDFMLDFTATDETGQIIHLSIFWYEQRLNGIRRSMVWPDGSVQLSDLVGYWLLSHATDEAGVEVGVTYSDWLIHAIEIFDDNSFLKFQYGTLTGDLIYAGNNTFTAINLVESAEGFICYPDNDELTISYDPQSGLLRYMRVHYRNIMLDDGTMLYTITEIKYYVRVDSLPWSN